MSTLPIDYGMSVPWAPDPRCVPKEQLGLLEGGRGARAGAAVRRGQRRGAGAVAPHGQRGRADIGARAGRGRAHKA